MADTTDPTGGNELDYDYAPVGLFCLTFWTSAIFIGLTGFAVTILTAKGFGPIILNEDHGITDGLAIAGILVVISMIMGFTGKAMVQKRQNLDAMWKLAYLVIPAAMVVLTIASIVVNH